MITFQPIDHSDGATHFRAQLVLANNDKRCVLDSDWSLFFNFVRRPLALVPPVPAPGFPSEDVVAQAVQQLADQGLTVDHADDARSGDFLTLRPTATFAPLAPGQQRTITMDVELWAVAKSDAPQGWSIAYGGGKPSWVPAKALLDPTDPNQTQAFSGDKQVVQTAATRFAENTTPLKRLDLADSLVPRPLKVEQRPGTYTLDGRTTITYERGVQNEAEYLESALEDVLRGNVRVAPTRRGSGGSIQLSLDPQLNPDGAGGPDPEGYKLAVTRSGIQIVGRDRAGLLYGIQTLRQLIPLSAYEAGARGKGSKTIAIPRAAIADAPLFPYRGMGIDVGRHFEGPDTIKKFLDLMSFLKLNKLHFHITDDEGWRLEIPGIPELTSFGANRGFDLAEVDMLHQAMGSGSDLAPGDRIRGKARNETEANFGRTPAYQGFEQATGNFVGKGSGYYTTREFRSMLKYATERHIEVIPEFDFPAHARAAVQSMERRYQRYKDSNPARANEYRLLDPDDTSEHLSVQYYTDNLVNPCIPTSYAFLTKVVTEVKAMYDAAGAPLSTVNLGGDEPPGPVTWQGSPLCQSNPDTAGKTDKQLSDYFFTRWNAIALTVAPRTSGWEDILLHTPGFTLENFVPLPWQNVWGWGREQVAYQFANDGIPVVLAHSTNLYMDLAYNRDPNEPGYYWANLVDEKSTFTYQPFDVYANATHDRWGNPFTPDPSWERLTAEGKRNILGLEANLWAENGKSPEIREYQAFPKLLGAAERAWNRNTPAPGAQMDAAWDVFVNTVGQVAFPLLSYYQPVGLRGTGVNYRIPLPGGTVEGGSLTANVRNPGMRIEYSTDAARWSTYRGPVRVGQYALLRTVAVDGRTSRISPVDVPTWAAQTRYATGALVLSNGELFRAKRTHSSQAGSTPDRAANLWTLIQ